MNSAPLDVAQLPATCAAALKEWSGVCRALASGRQSIVLRKGGIAERSGRFELEHPVFWLYPTEMHQQQQGIRDFDAERAGQPEPGWVEIDALAIAFDAVYTNDLALLEGLEDLHVWTHETVRQRFHYRTPGLWVIALRVYRARQPHRVAITDEQAGCKSWVMLEEPLPAAGARPVLSETDFELVLSRVRSLRGTMAGPAPEPVKGAPRD